MQEKINTLFRIHPWDGAKKMHIYLYCDLCRKKSLKGVSDYERLVILSCYNGYSRYAENIN